MAGPVSLTAADGTDLTPTSKKGRGLLALLGASTGLRITRAKAQDKLWSERAPEQGSASLRQTLAEIRKTLGDYRDALLSGPGWVGLDPELVSIDIELPAGAAAHSVEFAEDLDIRDPEFEDWIVAQRNHHAERWSKTAAPTILTHTASSEVLASRLAVILKAESAGDDGLEGFASATVRDAAQRAGEFMPLEIYRDSTAALDHPEAIEVDACAFGSSQSFVLHVALNRIGTGRQLWTKSFDISASSIAEDLRNISAEITLALLHSFSQAADRPKGFILPSFPDIFSFSQERLQQADDQLAAAGSAPSVLAMRAFIKNTQLLERMVSDPVQTQHEAMELVGESLERAPTSATVVAVASLLAARDQQLELASDLSERAYRADPYNPLARLSRIAAFSFTDQHDAARLEALQTMRLPLSELDRPTYAVLAALTSIRTGNLDEAVRYAAISHGHAPEFRPPLRVLSALRYHQGDHEGAADALRKLKAVEPDFSLELMGTEQYPVATLRKTKLLQITKSRLILD